MVLYNVVRVRVGVIVTLLTVFWMVWSMLLVASVPVSLLIMYCIMCVVVVGDVDPSRVPGRLSGSCSI